MRNAAYSRHWCLGAALLVAVTLTLGACGKRGGMLPSSGGKAFEVLVVNDQQDIVTSWLSSDVAGLPQPEPSFDVSKVDSAHFRGAVRLARNIVYVRIDSLRYPDLQLRQARNIYAKPQTVVYIGAPSVQALKEGMAGAGHQQLLNTLNASELRTQVRLLLSHRNVKAEQLIKRKFGVKMVIPEDLTPNKESEDFVWLSNNSPTKMENIVVYRDWNKWRNSNGLLYYYENEGTYFERARNYVLGRNILGETDSMHMSTVTVSMVNKEPGDWYHGLWEMTGDAMGGPFVSRLLNMPKDMFRGEYACFHVVGEGFVYAPGEKKRNAIRRLEAVLLTMRLDSVNKTVTNKESMSTKATPKK